MRWGGAVNPTGFQNMQTITEDKAAGRLGALTPKPARIAVAICFLLNGMLFACWVSRIPAVQAHLALTPGRLGTALLCLGFGAMLAMPAAAWGCARFGSRRVTQVCAVGFCAFLPVLALAPSALLLCVALFIFGSVHGGLDVAMNAQAVAVEKLYDRPIMSSFHALWSLGGLIGAALGGVLASAGVAPFTHFFTAVLLLGGIGFSFALSHLVPDGSAPASAATEKPADGARWKLSMLPGSLLVLGAISFCAMMGEGAMADWSALFLKDYTGASDALAPAGYAAFSIAMAGGRFMGDRLTARLGGEGVIRWSGVLAAAGLLLALLAPHVMLSLVGFFAVGAGFSIVIPVIFSASGRTPGIAAGTGLAVTTTLGYTGFLLGPPLIGFLADHMGLRSALGFTVFTSALLVILAPFARIPKVSAATPIASDSTRAETESMQELG